MSSSAATSSVPGDAPPTPEKAPALHPIIQNALRISLSAKEYRTLHGIATKRAPSIQTKLPSPSSFDAMALSKNRHGEAALRASLRVFVGSGLVLKLLEAVMSRVRGGATEYDHNALYSFCSKAFGLISVLRLTRKKPRTPLHRSPTLRLSFSLSLLLLLHRLLYRFLTRLRANLRTDDAEPFRERNPRISRALTSRFAPAVGASLAGLAVGIIPQEQLRLSGAIYFSTRSLEFLFNAADSKGLLDKRPWWFGSWLLMPLSCAQLFHAFIFDRETTPKVSGFFHGFCSIACSNRAPMI